MGREACGVPCGFADVASEGQKSHGSAVLAGVCSLGHSRSTRHDCGGEMAYSLALLCRPEIESIGERIVALEGHRPHAGWLAALAFFCLVFGLFLQPGLILALVIALLSLLRYALAALFELLGGRMVTRPTVAVGHLVPAHLFAGATVSEHVYGVGKIDVANRSTVCGGSSRLCATKRTFVGTYGGDLVHVLGDVVNDLSVERLVVFGRDFDRAAGGGGVLVRRSLTER
jgi:hypothetical protein